MELNLLAVLKRAVCREATSLSLTCYEVLLSACIETKISFCSPYLRTLAGPGRCALSGPVIQPIFCRTCTYSEFGGGEGGGLFPSLFMLS